MRYSTLLNRETTGIEEHIEMTEVERRNIAAPEAMLQQNLDIAAERIRLQDEESVLLRSLQPNLNSADSFYDSLPE